ncbi:hypothetical protein SAMN04487818_11577 [Actinokineospora terrae]|uniref:Uncharacterized protein n=1 Tax=Actinokineospora terrae TaxID=155974 RepID=A0A1H9XHU4_9PSEU|nr:hypothetical protein SAMN04487818_11577 [Actinokineospora terrae]
MSCPAWPTHSATGTAMTTPDSQALAAYPELQHLIDLRDTGWTFHVAVNGGHITQIYGHRYWPHG